MSALYPTPSPTAAAWLATLRATLAEVGGEVPAGPALDVESLAAHLQTEAPEAAELGVELEAALREFAPVISGLSAAFGIRPATIAVALGRGQPLGELDPVVAQAIGRVPELAPLTSSGTVTIAKDGRATTLIAATTVGPPVGPVRVPWPDREDRGAGAPSSHGSTSGQDQQDQQNRQDRQDRDDVWLCAVPAAEPLDAARAALARILPHVGVPRADVREGPRTGPLSAPDGPAGASPRAGHAVPARTLHAALLTVDPAADPDLVMARLEGWRTAVEQLHRGAVAIHWEQA
jgi:hypothetical protein